MNLPEPIHDILVIFLRSFLILGGLAVVLFTNPIYSAFMLGSFLILGGLGVILFTNLICSIISLGSSSI